MSPELTVVMPVYNGEKYLAEAVNSVLRQTFTDFELLIINDGSRDRSSEILAAIKDHRIRIVENDVNRGVAYCRNLGLKMAAGKYLTWTDCDDINDSTRFNRQVEFLNAHPEIAICGTAIKRFGDKKNYVFRPTSDPELLKALLVFRPSIPNATAMLRRSAIQEFNVSYNNDLPLAEDYDFIFSCSKVMKLTNLPDVLYYYRASETSLMKTVEGNETRDSQIHKVVYKRILTYLGLPATDRQLDLHYKTCSNRPITTREELNDCIQWLDELAQANQLTRRYEPVAFRNVISRESYFLCRKASGQGLSIFFFFLRHSMPDLRFHSPLAIAKLFGRCVLKKVTV